MIPPAQGENINRRAPTPLLRALALVLGSVWLVGSAAKGGLRTAVSEAWAGVSRGGRAQPGQADARNQWVGLYYDTLDALVQQPLHDRATIAVVLTPSHLPRFTGASAARMYETIYRFYPCRVDFYVRYRTGAEEVFWFRSPRDQVPGVPALWQHDYVILAAPGVAGRTLAHNYEAVYGNAEARIYRRKGG